MPWKTDEESNALIAGDDGNPVWIYEDGAEKGKEAPADFNRMFKKITDVTAESIARKEKIRQYDERYKPLADRGIEDLGTWLGEVDTALDTVKNYSDKDLVDAGEVDKVKQSVIGSYDLKIGALTKDFTGKLDTSQATIEAKDASIRKLLIRSAFDRSTFLAEDTVLLPDMAYTYFGDRFGVEETSDGELTGYATDKEGNKLMSLFNPGEIATPDEAIELLVSEHPQKDRMLKMDASGNGTPKHKESKGGYLMAQYTEAKKKGNVALCMSLKMQMQTAGISVPM